MLSVYFIFIKKLEDSKDSQNLPETWASAPHRGVKHCREGGFKKVYIILLQ